MAKRVNTDQLTGGSRDVCPQYMSGRVTMTAANTAVELSLGTPIVRVGPQTAGKSIIMELIRLYVDFPKIDQDNAAATDRTMQFSMTTTSTGGTPAIATLDNPRSVAFLSKEVRNAFTAAGTGILDINQDPHVWDFTDGAGHGILIATDNLFLQAITSGQSGASSFNFKLLYRFHTVSLVEYIGIVQSQQ